MKNQKIGINNMQGEDIDIISKPLDSHIIVEDEEMKDQY